MAGPRPEKVAVVEEVREHLGSSSAAILTEYRGLKVGDLASLRRQLRSAGADYKIFKNTLVRRATADTDQAALNEYLTGPTAIVFVRDDVGAAAKVLRDFSRLHPQLVVKGGLLGTQLVDAGGASALAELPSRDALLAQLAGAIAAPMRQFAGLLQALPRSLAYGLSALIEKRGGIADTAEAAEPTTGAAEPPTEAAAEPAATAEPAAAAERTEVADSSASSEPAETTEAEASESAEASEQAATSEPADSTETTESTETGESTEPAESTETGESTETAASADTAEG